MDPSEGRPYIAASEQELPPLYESVNSKDSEKAPLCSNINRTYLPFKAFFYFFYGAIGSLFPFLALYFRHLWLSPTQAGLLVGLRPIIQSITTPFWALFADRFNAKKIVLFIGLCGWLFAHACLLLVPAGKKPLSCAVNSTHVTKRSLDFIDPLIHRTSQELNTYPEQILDYNPVDITPIRDGAQKRREHDLRDSPNHNYVQKNMDEKEENSRQEFPKNSSVPTSPLHTASEIRSENIIKPNSADNFNLKSKDNDNGKGSWLFISSAQEPLDTWHTFTYLFLIILIGNLFAAPAQTMANTATLQALGDDTHRYGTQRCFGSIGWGVSAFVVGMLVSMNHDSSLACKGLDDINYTPCFYAFGVLMLCAVIVAITFKFRSAKEVNPRETRATVAQIYQQLDCLTLFLLFTVLLAGFNMGFIQTFLFWYLQSLGGTQNLFSLILGFNAVGEMIGFLLSVKLISKFGHLKVLALGIFAYAVRLTVYGVVGNPWLVLIVELLKAFTSSAVWAAAMSYVGDSCTNGSTLAAIVHMLYWGVGYGGGGMLGGVLMEAVGARSTFLGLAVISLIVVILTLVIVHLNCFPKRKQEIYMPVESDDEDVEQDSDE
jgi:MFS family permease